jgi:predicted tellurium resistance membrane protein TerC
LYSKLVSKDVPGYIAALSLMTIIGTSMIAHAMNKCDNANDTQKSYNSIYLTVSILALLFSVFIMVFA